MLSKKQVTVFIQKVLEEKIVTAMLITILTLPLYSYHFLNVYFNDNLIAIIVMLLTAIIAIPNSRVYITKQSKYIKNILAILFIGYAISTYFNYGNLKIGGDILVFLSVLLIFEANPIIINSIKKWWTTT